MATTEAQKRAKAKYEAAKVTRKVVKFYPGSEDLLAHLEKQPSQNDCLIDLIRRDLGA